VADLALIKPPGRFAANRAQITILIFITLFLIAFLIVPLLRVIVVAFAGPDGAFSLVHVGDFFRTGLLREAFLNSIYVGVMTVALQA
jgi:ABC-type spermidine/putrescine transport system permease subunit II